MSDWSQVVSDSNPVSPTQGQDAFPESRRRFQHGLYPNAMSGVNGQQMMALM
jgi:hypothetical protein